MKPLALWVACSLAGIVSGADFAGYPTVDSPEVMKRGLTSAATLGGALQERLKGALAGGDTAGALWACSVIAPPLTEASQDPGQGILEVRRVTDRPRNQGNLTDPMDAKVFAAIRERPADQRGQPVAIDEGDGIHARVYKPLFIQPLCLQCHGPQERLAPEVIQALNQRYPEDRATGYAEGDLRGLIRVRLDMRQSAGPAPQKPAEAPAE